MSTTPTDKEAWPYPRWVAHRGAGKLAPENTLAAFRKGASLGYRMFECDVKLSADGVPFLLHDDTLLRTTNAIETLGTAASAVAGDHPWGTLAQLDAGSWHSRTYAGEPLPTFDAIARYCLRNAFHPVSYTHLDVYKRQLLPGCARRTTKHGHWRRQSVGHGRQEA